MCKGGLKLNVSTISGWAPHLKDPVVLVGFFIMLFAIIITTLLKSKTLSFLTESSERLIGRVTRYTFILGIIVIVLGFGLAFWKNTPEGNASAPKITQTTKGDQSPAVATQGEKGTVNIQYGDTKDPKKARQTNDPAQKDKEGALKPSQGAIQQQTEGSQSPAIVSGGNVNLTIEGKKK